MKKRLLSVALALLFLLLALASCGGSSDGSTEGGSTEGGSTEGGEGGTEGEGGSAEVDPDPDHVYSERVMPILVYNTNTPSDVRTTMYRAVKDATGSYPQAKSDKGELTGHEILLTPVGSQNSLAVTAQSKLDRLLGDERARDPKNADLIEGFVIYASGSSVAVVWSSEYLVDVAVNYFLENFLDEKELKLENGYTYAASENIIDVVRAEEAEKYALQLDKIADAYSEELADEIDQFISKYDDRFIIWLANLYDPGQYDAEGNPLGGGFYYSNSARDTVGFLPDLESTGQILSFLNTSGMLPGSWKDYIPEKMQKELVAFALSCQSPVDGYFYHPQWGTDIIESRRSRDMGWGVSILGHFGYKPYYDTPGGTKGSLGPPPGEPAPTGRLSSSVTAAAELVLAASSGWVGSDKLTDLETWRAYLDSFEATIRTKSYSIGNTVAGFSDQAKNREKMAIAAGELVDADGDGRAENGYLTAFEERFNAWQLAENGLWEYGTVADGTVTYQSINGLMKLSVSYNDFKAELPNAEKALESAIFMITFTGDENGRDVAGDAASRSVDVYNPWVCVDMVLKNIRTYGDKALADRLQEQIQQNAVEMVRVTNQKISKFAKEDGSYGYTWSVSPHFSQMAPVSVPNTVEGDVNGGLIASNGLFRYIERVLNISIDLFDSADYILFIHTVNGLGEVIKKSDAE